MSETSISNIKKSTKLGYSVGHVLNDLCAAMWFSYLLVYFHQVLKIDANIAGYLLLIGQMTDGLATPIVGIESDRFGLLGKYYGRRKSWHVFGTFCVMISFVFIFTPCPDYNPDVTPQFVPLIYYSPFIVIFQIGWASTQVSHLSIIPNLTRKEQERGQLNSFRYAFTVLSSIVVYGLAFAFLQSSAENELGYEDRKIFSNLALIVVGVGSIFSALFHFYVPEKIENDQEESSEDEPLIANIVQPPVEGAITAWTEWFKVPNFYITAIIYMLSRLIVNMSQVYMPFYLTDVLLLHKSMIAIVPLIIFLMGFFTSLIIPIVSKKFSPHVIYVFGCVSVISSFIWAYYLAEPLPKVMSNASDATYEIIGVAIFNGLGCACILISSLTITANLIGQNTCTAAFVYGAMSLTDKIANGLAVVTIQNLDPCACDCEDCGYYFRAVLTLGGGIISICGAATVIFHYFYIVRPKRILSDYVRINEE